MEVDEDCKKIYLTYLNGTGYIFNAKDYIELRQKHRVLGAFVGTFPQHNCTTNESGLPVELMPWEVRLLVEENLAILVSKSKALHDPPTSNIQKLYTQYCEISATKQKDLFKQQKLQCTQENIKNILSGKRSKLDNQINEQDVLKETENNFVYNDNCTLLEIPSSHTETLSVYVCQILKDRSLKYCVFRDLWLRNKYVTSGETFGCDFLVYPNDPMLYHASHMIILLHSKTTIDILKFIAKLRLSVSVNKKCMLAYFVDNKNDEHEHEHHDDEEWPEIAYQNIKWKGNLLPKIDNN